MQCEEGKRMKKNPKPHRLPHLCTNLTWMLFKGGRNEQAEEASTETGKLLNTAAGICGQCEQTKDDI